MLYVLYYVIALSFGFYYVSESMVLWIQKRVGMLVLGQAIELRKWIRTLATAMTALGHTRDRVYSVFVHVGVHPSSNLKEFDDPVILCFIILYLILMECPHSHRWIIWRSPNMGVPPNHRFIDGFSTV